jgi:predicted RNA-binding Zn-ribbon protein involved in translation (DUF1610 family)
MAKDTKKRKCNGCGEDVETDDSGNYTCSNCGYDREAARAHLRKQEALEREKKELEEERKKGSKGGKAWTF